MLNENARGAILTRELPDGRVIDVYARAYNTIIVVSPDLRSPTFDAQW